MKITIIILLIIIMALALAYGFKVLYPKDDISQFTEVCQDYAISNHYYSPKINYFKICKAIEKNSNLFQHDKYLIASIIFCESEFCTNAVHTNYQWDGNITIDIGTMQVNTVWSGRILMPDVTNCIMFNPEVNIYAGCYVFEICRLKYPNNIYEAIWAYNGICENNRCYPERVLECYYRLQEMKINLYE